MKLYTKMLKIFNFDFVLSQVPLGGGAVSIRSIVYCEFIAFAMWATAPEQLHTTSERYCAMLYNVYSVQVLHMFNRIYNACPYLLTRSWPFCVHVCECIRQYTPFSLCIFFYFGFLFPILSICVLMCVCVCSVHFDWIFRIAYASDSVFIGTECFKEVWWFKRFTFFRSLSIYSAHKCKCMSHEMTWNTHKGEKRAFPSEKNFLFKMSYF